MTTCRICGENKKIKIKFKKNSFNTLICQKCGLTYLDHQPGSAEIKKLYSKNYFLGKGLDFGYYNYFEEKENLVKTSNSRLTKIEKLIKVGKILDVGCATGFFLEAANKRGWKIFGIEVSEYAGRISKRKFGKKIVIDELKEGLFPKNFFNAVTLWDTIEHLENPKKTLTVIYDVLKKDGVIGLSTGDIDSLFAKISGGGWHLYHLPEHLSFFSPRTITRLLEDCGFKVVSISHPGSYYTFEYLVRRLTGSYPNPIFKLVEKLITTPLLSKLSLYINLFDIMTVHAKKK